MLNSNENNIDKRKFDHLGYDKNGFDRNGIHRYTNTKFNLEGFDMYGYDRLGYDRNDFDRNGIYKYTGTKFDFKGFDIFGFDRNGFNINKIHRDTNTEFAPNGFNINGIHKDTGTEFNLEGFDMYGYDNHGYDKNGFDRNGFNNLGFNKDGIHKDTNTEFNKQGFNINGIHRITNTKFNTRGFDRNGFNVFGFNKNGIHKDTNTMFDPKGFDKNGINKDTDTKFDLNGFDRNGFNTFGYNQEEIYKFGKISKQEALALAKKYINDEFYTIKDFSPNGYVTKQIKFILKQYYPEIYNDFMLKAEKNSKKSFAILLKKLRTDLSLISNGIKTQNGETIDIDYVDYTLLGNFDINTLAATVSCLEPGFKRSKKYREFMIQYDKRNKKMLNTKQELEAKNIFLIDDKEIIVSKEDKEKIITFMQIKNIPMEQGYYILLLRKHINRQINIDDLTKEDTFCKTLKKMN